MIAKLQNMPRDQQYKYAAVFGVASTIVFYLCYMTFAMGVVC